jgi:hypothetical protein
MQANKDLRIISTLSIRLQQPTLSNNLIRSFDLIFQKAVHPFWAAIILETNIAFVYSEAV